MRLFILACLLFFGLTLPAQAQYTAPGPAHTAARLVSPVTATGDGTTVPLALDIQIDDGWKIYWRSPGDAGLPPALDWTGSVNLSKAEMHWPAPHRFTTADIDNIGYKHHVTFPLTATLSAPGQPLKLALKLDLLVCSDICVPETKTLTFDLPAGAATASAEASVYDAAMKTLPQPATDKIVFGDTWLDVDDENRQILMVKASMAAAPEKGDDLFVEHPSGNTFGAPVTEYDAGTQTALFRVPVHSTAGFEKLAGELKAGDLVLTYVGADGTAYEGYAKLGAKTAADPAASLISLGDRLAAFDLRIVLLALLGGLILNLMPCVLPVLSLKVLSVVSHGGKDNRWDIFKNFMASALGILASFWLMAAVLSGIKTAGGTIGWGIQFQHPLFLVTMVILLGIFAANLWGFFEISLPRAIADNIPSRHTHEPTLLGHFLTGAFATLLATPCTAPFLGTAVGFALARGTLEIFMIFTLLGIGLALPYIILAFSPRLFKHMPKPGAWMIKLKKILAVAIAITALWLGSIVVTIGAAPALDSGWQGFDESKIQSLVDDGKTVVVDVTADWCLTCKANKKLVLQTSAVREMLSADNIVLMQADWTERDEHIAAYLQKYGRYGIPFNIVYGPGAPEGIPLPELLTRDALAGALAEAAGE